MRKAELAYMAGFFDGEGCISIGAMKYKNYHNYQLGSSREQCPNISEGDKALSYNEKGRG